MTLRTFLILTATTIAVIIFRGWSVKLARDPDTFGDDCGPDDPRARAWHAGRAYRGDDGATGNEDHPLFFTVSHGEKGSNR